MNEFLQSAGYTALLVIGGWVLSKTGIFNTPPQRNTQRPTQSVQRTALPSRPEQNRISVTIVRGEIEGRK